MTNAPNDPHSRNPAIRPVSGMALATGPIVSGMALATGPIIRGMAPATGPAPLTLNQRPQLRLATAALAVVVCWLLLTIAPPPVAGQEPSPPTATPPPTVPEPKPMPQSESEHAHTNRLIDETSPYLLQHAHNPVNWYPWGEEAFERAKREDKPIFLSVGYSTCYWCHVMEIESFESEEVAEVLNEHFIAIKVDREERPDIDEQYMLITQLITRRGGWPNSVWLKPDGKPWMAGTYFPKQQFISSLQALAEIWKTRRDEVDRQADTLVAAAARIGESETAATVPLTADLVRQGVSQMLSRFDEVHGGIGDAPKFPPHATLELLIRQFQVTQDESLLKPITKTLDAIWLGGMHDHIGGGFHRYSTDAQWLLPHFEKMLYDNAQLVRVYTAGFELTGNPRYRDAVADIHGWVVREMTADSGGFFSALDSGEVGKEGEAYIWTNAQVDEALNAEDAALFREVYRFRPEGNFREEATGELTGANIPHLSHPLEQVAEQRGVDRQAFADRLADIRSRLLDARQRWPQPHKDDKVLTSWNGLMIGALAKAGRVLDTPEYIGTAQRAADFILDSMLRDGQLLRTYRAGQAKTPGYLDDYVYFIEALLELHQATDQPRWLTAARSLADRLLADFQDREAGGFFFTSNDHEDLMVRSKHLAGGGNLPGPNGVAAQVLIELGELTGQAVYRDAAEQTLTALTGLMAQQPYAAEHLLIATSRLLETATDANQPLAAKPGADGFVRRVDPVTITSTASPTRLAPGESATVTVRLAIDDGWHLYADNPDADFVRSTTIQVDANDRLTIGEVIQPDALSKADPVLKRDLQTYQGTVEFRITVTAVADAAPGTALLKSTLTTQACDDRRCLEAQQTKLSLPLEIIAPQ